MWLINACNFIDGLDSLLGQFAIIGLMFLGIGRQTDILLIISGLLISFLLRNSPSAKLYFGDVGSNLIGLLLAMSFHRIANTPAEVEIWHLLLLFSPLIFDTTTTLLLNLASGQPVWRPHRHHGYQRLALRWGLKAALLIEMALIMFSIAYLLLLLQSAIR